MRIGSLFSGIGGLELGLEASGLGHTVWQVEQSEFCRDVLARHWPKVERFEDVKEVGARNLSEVDLICGGFPCQDISSAGKGAGLYGSRSGLWFEYARIIKEMRPAWVVVENVASGASRWVTQVTSHLAELGYETLPIPISAADVGAPHLRKRVFLVAHSEREQLRKQSRRSIREEGQGSALPTEHGQARNVTNTDSNSKPTRAIDGEVANLQESSGSGERHAPDSMQTGRSRNERGGCEKTHSAFAGDYTWHGGTPIAPVCGVDDGFPDRTQRLRALGNAVVPQCAEVVGWVIRELVREGTL